MKDIYSPLEIDEEWDQRAPQFDGNTNAAPVAVAGEMSGEATTPVAVGSESTQPAAFGDAQPLEIGTPHPGDAEAVETSAQAEVATDTLAAEPAQPEAHTEALGDTTPVANETLAGDAPSEPSVISSETQPSTEEAPVAETPGEMGDTTSASEVNTEGPAAMDSDLPAPPAPDTTFQPQAMPEGGVASPSVAEPNEHLDVVGDEKDEVADAEAAADGKEDAETGDLPVSPVDHDAQATVDAEPEAPAVIEPTHEEAAAEAPAEEPSAEFAAEERNPLEEALNNYHAGLEKEKQDLENARSEVVEQLEAAKKREDEAQAALKQAERDVQEAKDGQAQIDDLITKLDGLLEDRKKAA